MKVENFAKRKTDVSIIVFLALAILGQLIIPNDECVACTVGVASGHVTMDGRPLACKARGARLGVPQVLVWVDGEPYDYIGVRDIDETRTPMGLNAAGVSGGNASAGNGGYHSQDYLLEHFDDTNEILSYYEAFVSGELEFGWGNPYWEQSCFIHIDAYGDASIFEVNATNWVYEYEAMDPDREAQGLLGFVVRANEFHAHPDGTDDTSITGGRYESGTYNVKGLVDINMLCARTLVQGNDGANGYEFSRYGPGRELASISGLSGLWAGSFIAIHGVAPGEDPALSTMWSLLGHTDYSIAVPAWVKVWDIPERLSNGDLYLRARSLCLKNEEAITQASVFPAEAHLFDMVENRLLPHWRARGVPSVAEMTRVEHQMANDAYSLLDCLDNHQNDNRAPEVAFDGIPHTNWLALTFTATAEDSDGTIVNIEWNFGDDQNSVGDSVSHTYSEAGTYLVSCTVTDDDGVSATDWRYFDVVDYDLVDDNVINILDLAEFINHWLETDCEEPNWCGGTDFNRDQTVNFHDFALFSQRWLHVMTNPTFIFAPNSPELSLARDSIAYDYNFNEFDVDIKRIETVCLASRPEVTVNMDVSLDVFDVDGNEALCGFAHILYTTMDGETFTAILDIRSATPLDSGGYFSDYTTSQEIAEALRVMDDGSWLLSTGRKLPGVRGHLFRSTNKGTSWSICKFAADGNDFYFDTGFVPNWGPVVIADNEIVLGEYGYPNQQDNPRRVYYSDDYGSTWTMIIDIGAAGWQPGDPHSQHFHAASFGIGDTNIVYAVWGDYIFNRFKKFKCIGDKKNPANWTEVDMPWRLFAGTTAPVCLFNDGCHIYVGRDGGFCPTLWRFDANENRETVISFPTQPGTVKESVPYRCPYSDSTYVFRMIKHEGVFYAAVSAHSWQKRMAGIYVSTDGEHWVCARRFFGELGPHTIVGYANGYIWGTYKDEGGTRRLFKFTPVKAKVVPGLRVERGIVNIANSVDQSCFDTAIEGWTMDGNIDSVVWTDTEPLMGSGCVEVVCKDGAGEVGRVYTKAFAAMGGSPSQGDYICFSCWVKAAASWPAEAKFRVLLVNSTNIDYYSAPVALNQTWQRVVMWGQCIGTPLSSLKGKFWLDANSYAGSYSDLKYYIDGVQMVYLPDMHYSGAWQKGGTPRADELAALPLTGLSNSFTLSFTWLPDSGSREWHDDCPIASIVGIDGSFLELFWDQSESEFAITDGTHTEIIDSSGMGFWEHPEMVKFAIVCDGYDTDLYIENPVNGLAFVIGSNGCTLTGLPSCMLLASNNDQTRLGSGLFSTVKAWDWEFTPIDVNEIFDTID